MKVFIGWSGDTSHEVAIALRDWLPKVIQALKPFVSSEDMAKGSRWSAGIAAELQASYYGIICITPENSNSAWINFEAGALSREIEKSLVSPFLFGLKTSDIQGPLSQFQAVVNEEDDVRKLMLTINDRQPDPHKLEKANLEATFNMWWPKLKEELNKIEQNEERRPAAPKRQTHELVEELLDTVRTLRSDQAERLEVVAGSQIAIGRELHNRMTELAGVVSALARSVESLHGGMSDIQAGLPDKKLSNALAAFYGEIPPGNRAEPEAPAPSKNFVSQGPVTFKRNKTKL